MKRFLLFLVFVFLLIAAFFAYRYFSIEAQEDSWEESQYQAYEPLCEIEFPILINETGNNNSKVKYVMTQSRLFFPLPSQVLGGSRKGSFDNAVTIGFEKTCATTFNYFLLYDLYPDHVREPFLKHNQAFEEQSTAKESSAQHCDLTVSLPNIYEEFQERLTQHVKLRIKSFEGITTVNPLNGHTMSAQLSFNSACEQVLADYIMQDLMPADYFQMMQ